MPGEVDRDPRSAGVAPIRYDSQAYTELLLRAVESLLAPVGVDRATLETWLLADAGYWGPPGILPPAGADIRTPLMDGLRLPAADLWPRAAALRPLRIPLAADYKTPIAHGAAV